MKIPRIKDKSLNITEDVQNLIECEPYQLPPKRPIPPISEDLLRKINDLKISNQATNGTKETTWLLLRMIPYRVLPSTNPTDKIVVPNWKGYNAKISCPNSVNYKQRLTLYTSMAQCKQLTKSLGQDTSIQTMDQQLYALAQEVKWDCKDEFKSHILRMGSFHAIMTYLSSIGRIWGDAGLRDLLVDSGVYAAGTAELFLQGKEYNRAVKAYIHVYEALSQVRLTEFLKYLEQKKQKLPDELWEHLSATKDLFYSGSMPQSAVIELQNLVEKHVQPLMAEFRAELSEKSPTFQLWDSLIEALHNLLLNLRAEREGDWPLHLHSFLSFLPYYAITDKPNYTRYSPVYLMDMLALPDDVERAFNRGEFSVRETCGGFIGTASDMGTEHKVKVLKGHGELKNMSKKIPSMIRYSLTRHVTGNWATQLKRRANPKFTEN